MCNDPEHMEEPCLCDCNTWFDLQDGYPSMVSNKVICHSCYGLEQEEKKICEQLDDLYFEYSNEEVGKRETKSRVKHLLNKEQIEKFLSTGDHPYKIYKVWT